MVTYKNISYLCRWYWNKFRYWAGLTCLSPAAHEFRRMMKELGYKEVK